jgi:hypothetical protein
MNWLNIIGAFSFEYVASNVKTYLSYLMEHLIFYMCIFLLYLYHIFLDIY